MAEENKKPKISNGMIIAFGMIVVLIVGVLIYFDEKKKKELEENPINEIKSLREIQQEEGESGIETPDDLEVPENQPEVPAEPAVPEEEIETETETETPKTSTEEDEMIACPMDAKSCPDGSFVGREAPDCEFAPCPGE